MRNGDTQTAAHKGIRNSGKRVEEGLVVASGNPKQSRSVADLGRSDVTIVNCERGAGSRLVLDAQLRRLGISHARLRG